MAGTNKGKGSYYQCTLSPEILEKAVKELNEDPNTRLIEVKNLKTRLEGVSGLYCRTDVPFLLRFLRARKFDQERSFQLVKNYYQVRVDSPDIFDDLKPSRVKHVIDDGMIEVLENRDNNGCRVIVFRPAKWDPDRYPIVEMNKAVFLVISKLLEEEETQVNGLHIINNLANITWKQASHIGPTVAKRISHIMQDVIPMRLKRFDYMNEPTFFDVVFAIMKQFMKEKLTKRIVLNGDKCDKLHESINPDYLPTDLGGKKELYSYKTWMDNFMASDAQFEEDNKYGFVKMKVDTDKKTSKSLDADIAGLGGTFKKLDV